MSGSKAFAMFIETPGDVVDHPKVLAITNGERLAALGLYALVGSWAARYSEDGTVPTSVAEIHDLRGGRLSTTLVNAGLWRHEGSSYRFVHWHAPLTEPEMSPS